MEHECDPQQHNAGDGDSGAPHGPAPCAQRPDASLSGVPQLRKRASGNTAVPSRRSAIGQGAGFELKQNAAPVLAMVANQAGMPRPAAVAYPTLRGGSAGPALGGLTGDQRVFLNWVQAWAGSAPLEEIWRQAARRLQRDLRLGVLTDAYEGIATDYGKRRDRSSLEVVGDLVEETIAENGVVITDCHDGRHYVDVPFTPETTPSPVGR